MFFIYYLVTLLSVSLLGPTSHSQRGLENVLQNEVFQQMIFAGDITGIQKFIFQFALTQISKNKDVNSASIDSAMLQEGISRLQPKIAAMVFIDKLVKAKDRDSQKMEARKIVEDGLFRKLDVRGKDSQKTTEISLRWAKDEMKKGDLAALIEERKFLYSKTETELRQEILRAAGQE